jgi:hypothetical protein
MLGSVINVYLLLRCNFCDIPEVINQDKRIYVYGSMQDSYGTHGEAPD